MQEFTNFNINNQHQSKRGLSPSSRGGVLGSQYKRHKTEGEQAHPLDPKQADFCSWWCRNFPHMWRCAPGLEHCDALGFLIGAPAPSVEAWFKEGFMKLIAPAPDGSGSTASGDSLKHIPYLPPDQRAGTRAIQKNHKAPEGASQKFSDMDRAEAVIDDEESKESDGSRCKTLKDLQELVYKNSDPWQCTRGCGRYFRRKKEWKRHEEKNYPPKEFHCLVEYVKPNGSCGSCPTRHPDVDHIRGHQQDEDTVREEACDKVFYRKDHLRNHLRSNVHRDVINLTDLDTKSWSLPLNEFPTACGFCKETFDAWEGKTGRIDHISDHFEKGKKSMREWNGIEHGANSVSDRAVNTSNKVQGRPPNRALHSRNKIAAPDLHKGQSFASTHRALPKMFKVMRNPGGIGNGNTTPTDSYDSETSSRSTGLQSCRSEAPSATASHKNESFSHSHDGNTDSDNGSTLVRTNICENSNISCSQSNGVRKW
jgi:hypothetical protein